MLLLASSRAGAAPLPAGLRATDPWLATAAFDAAPLDDMARALKQLPVSSLPLMKAFDDCNYADVFASHRPSIQWACERGGCGDILGHDITLAAALQSTKAPVSARVATARDSSTGVATAHDSIAATDELAGWLEALGTANTRGYRDADVYLTAAPFTSASLGWHVDDIDVLLVMMQGSKRFRVAGRTVGSDVVIDHMMKPGDAIYIPALTFHSGGSNLAAAAEGDASSCLLSVAFALPCPEAGTEAAEAVTDWRKARQAVISRLPAAGSNDWAWAGSEEGRHQVGRILRLNPAWRRFTADGQDGEPPT